MTRHDQRKPLTLVASLCLLSTSLWAEPTQVAIVQKNRVHPVLIRNRHNEVGQLTIDVRGDQEVTLRGLDLSFNGTSELSDIEMVELIQSNATSKFMPGQTLGQTTPPQTTMTFDPPVTLRPGKQVYWLSCRLKGSASIDRRVQVTATAGDTSFGHIPINCKGSLSPHRVGVALRQAGEEGVHTYRIPALATSRADTLLCVYDIRRRNGRDLQGDIDVGLSRSIDGGQNWLPMQVIIDMGEFGGLPANQNGIGDPGIVVDRTTGEIFVFALWVHAKPGKHQWHADGSEAGFEIGKTAQFMMTRSTDDGLTWTPPENLTRTLKREDWLLFAPSPQQGIQLRDGTLVMPAQGRMTDNTFANVIISRDHGKTWQTSPSAHFGGNECQAAELADGSIMLNIRNGDKKRRAVVTSADAGQTWNPHPTHEKDLIEPTCNASLYRWTSSNSAQPALLLFANPQDPKKRIRQTIQASTDDGLTWPVNQRVLLDEGVGNGYPSISRVNDDHVGIVYEGSQAHLVFERLTRSEFLDRESDSIKP
jgi:sialidase-1